MVVGDVVAPAPAQPHPEAGSFCLDHPKGICQRRSRGHPPALLLRADGGIEELKATSAVLGLFADWECSTAETRISTGDTLLLYTDGVTEWFNAEGAEFGADRLVAAVRRGSSLGASALLDRIVAELRDFGGEEQRDDVTLIIAKRGPV